MRLSVSEKMKTFDNSPRFRMSWIASEILHNFKRRAAILLKCSPQEPVTTLALADHSQRGVGALFAHTGGYSQQPLQQFHRKTHQ
jgi:hypothetical protein